MIKDFGLKIFNGSQNFYARCSLGAAQNFTASRDFAEAEARFNARNFNAQTSRSASDTAARCFNTEQIRAAREILPLRTIPLRSELAPLHKILARKILPSHATLLRSRLVLPHKILSLAPSRHTQIKSGPAHSRRRALGGSNVLPRLVMSPCRVWINLLSPCRRVKHGSSLPRCRAEHGSNLLARTITLEG